MLLATVRITDRFALSLAARSDLDAVKALLRGCELPSEDVDAHIEDFIVARSGGGLAGVIGLEALGTCGLLRSLAARPDVRSMGLGKLLCESIERHAETKGVKTLYLLTTGAVEYFSGLGYARMERELAAPAIRETAEFRHLCPSTATLMVKQL